MNESAAPPKISARWRAAGLTGATSALLQCTVALVGLVSTPLLVKSLGAERYGVWLAISSLLAWLSLADVGIGGNALVNAIAEAHGRDDRRWQREITTTAFWLLAAVALTTGALFWLAVDHVPWSRLLSTSKNVPAHELRAAISLAVCFLLVELPLRTISAAFFGTQRGYVSNLWSVGVSVSSLAILGAVSLLTLDLPRVVYVLWGSRLVGFLLLAFHFFSNNRDLLPSPFAVTLVAGKRLTRLGTRYLVAQAGSYAMFQSQPLLIAPLAGPAEAATFGVAHRVATMPVTLVAVLLSGVMPAYGDARARGDWPWIRNALRRSFSVGLLSSGVLGILAATVTPWFVAVWIGRGLVPPRELAWALGAYVFVGSAVAPISVLLYGVERVGKQALIAVLNGVAVVGLACLCVPRWGGIGMACAMLGAVSITNLPMQYLEAKRLLDSYARSSSP